MMHAGPSEPPASAGPPTGRAIEQAFGLWGGMLVWLFSFVAVWGITEIDCRSEAFSLTLLGMPSAMLIALVIIALSSLTALGAAFVASAQRTDDPGLADDAEDPRPFIARFGVLLNGLFVIVIMAGALPFFLLRTCG